MRCRTLLLAGCAALFLTAPAVAQEAMTSPTPSAPTAQTPPPAGSIQIQPGSNVRGSDGTVLGVLEGVRNTDAGAQELTVRGADGELRGVPLAGLTQQGADVVVGWSSTEYQAAPAIANAPVPEWNAPPSEGEPATTEEPATADEATPPEGETDPTPTPQG